MKQGHKILPRECTGHCKHPLPTIQETALQVDITRWSTLKWDWLYSLQSEMEKQKQVRKKWLGADWLRSWAPYGKFRLKWKKVWKTTRPFRYDLNQIPYDYIVGVTNRFKGLDLIDRVPEELRTKVHNIVYEVVAKTIQRKQNARKQNGCLRRPYK